MKQVRLSALISQPRSAALAFIVSGFVWFVIGTLYGMISAMHLVAPEIFNNMDMLVFGRARPAHINTVLFGFVVSTLIGCALYTVPALLRTSLWSEKLGWLSWLLWNLTVLSGPVTFAFGISQGREYAEYIWPADVLVVISMLLLAVNLWMTIRQREEKVLYVSVWYFMAAFVWTIGFYPIGNVMWHPGTGALPGLVDSLILWFYGHNLPGLLLTPLAVGAAYYVIPRVTKTPLYSHTLSLIGFWTLVAFYSHIGGHHVLQAPVPTWLKSITVVDSVAMVIPVFTVLVNIWFTARGRGIRVLSNGAGLLVMIGLVWYLITCIQGPMQSLPFIQRVTHFNNWTVGHAHIAILGFSGFIALGTAWHVLPQILKRELYSEQLVKLQFWLVLIGLAGFFVVLTIAGLIQGSAWYNGEMVYRVLPEIAPYMVLRASFGMFIITGAFVGLYNLIMTLRTERPVEAAPPVSEAEVV